MAYFENMTSAFTRRILTITATLSLLVLAGSDGPGQSNDELAITYPQHLYTLPIQYNSTDIPWLTETLDAKSLVQRYREQGNVGLVVDAWPWINIMCAPNIYPHWENLPDEMKLGSVHQQQMCWDTLKARTVEDIEAIKVLTENKLRLAGQIWGERTPSYGRYITALGLIDDSLPKVDPVRKDRPKTEQAAIVWLTRQIDSQSGATQSLWVVGKTVGPFTPSSQWRGTSWDAKAETKIPKGPDETLVLLENMATARGLVGLRLPVGWANTTDGWVEASRRIDRVADLIEKRSKLGGGGFGLWGSVFFDWRIPSKPELAALTIRYGDFYLIQAQEDSMGHEWFHAFQHWTRLTGFEKDHIKLFEDISRMKYNKRQTRDIFQQSHEVLAKNKAASAWIQALNGQGKESIWHFQNHQKIHENIGASAYWYAQAAWTLAPRIEPGETHWMARRRVLEETLKSSGWTGVGMVQPGYYTQPNEITASAFQGDINLIMMRKGWKDNAMPGNLIGSPLPVESMAMEYSFTRMFSSIEKQREAASISPAEKPTQST